MAEPPFLNPVARTARDDQEQKSRAEAFEKPFHAVMILRLASLRTVPRIELIGPEEALAVDEVTGGIEALPFPQFELSTVEQGLAPFRVADLVAAGRLQIRRGVRIDDDELSEGGRPLIGPLRKNELR